MQKDFVIKAKHAVKRVAAISAGATLMGATMMGAVAADLGDYPAPFVSDGELNGLVVVGSGANAADIVGAVDIVSTLTQATVSGASASTVTTGGEDKEIALDANLSGFGTLDDEDLAGLMDKEIEWNDSDIDVHEEIILAGEITILTSGESNGEDKMGADPYIGTTGANGITYKYVFEENINTANQDLLAGVDTDDSLTISILGNSVEITDMAAGAFTYKLADEYSLFVGESVTVEGKTVSLVNVAEGSSPANVVINVDGEQETVGSSSEDVNGIDIEVSETFYSDNLAERFAVIRAGSDISKTATSGEAVEMFGGDDTDSKNEWEWTIDLDESSNSYIGVEYDAVSDELDDNWAPFGIGESLSFPNDYATVTFDSLTSNDYTTYNLDFGGTESINDTTTGVMELTSSTDDGIYVNSAEEVESVLLDIDYTGGNYSWYWQDDDGVWVSLAGDNSSDTQVQLQYDAGSYATISVINDSSASGSVFNITFDTDDVSGVTENISVFMQKRGSSVGDDIRLGDSEDEEADEVQMGGSNFGTREYDVLFDGGLIIRNPDSNGQGDGSVEFDLPSEEIKANVIVSGPGTTTTSTEYSSVTINSVAGMDVVKLDSEVTDAAAKNLILVGGPAVNSLTAEALGLSFPTYGADSGIPEGAALLKSIDNAFGGSNSALVVAGWSADDTRNAARYLQAYSSNSLSGDSMTVTGPSTATSGGEATAE